MALKAEAIYGYAHFVADTSGSLCEVVDPAETALVSRVPLRAFINPDNRIMVYRSANTRRYAGPAFLLNQMLVWGFTGQVISALLDVAGWAAPWDSKRVMELDDALALVGGEDISR